MTISLSASQSCKLAVDDAPKPTCIDLFCGAGGFSQAALELEFKIQAAVEIDPHACDTYRHNIGKKSGTRLFQGDIDDLDFSALKSAMDGRSCDVVLGGPPCQGFSVHRINGAGVGDPRNRLVDDFVSTRSKQLMERMGYLLEQVEHSRIDLSTAMHLIDEETDDIDRENEDTLAPIVSALESLTESINLELLASTSTDEVLTLQSELERINSLAQLGITVEIVSHELESYDSTMEHGLQNLPAEIKETLAYRQIKTGHEGLTARLRFLSPLKLSGEPERRMISGVEIYNYVRAFFANDLEARLFLLDCNDGFENFKIYDQPSRLFPVFLNLVNNARYWVMQSPTSEHKVRIEAKGNEVIIADDGRGIPEEDLKSLFSLFFTRKQGGRGVGLYLCKANLAMGGHQISYIRDSKYKILPGANFSIKFRTS